MRVHFSAAIPCALRLGGAPAGMCGEAEKFLTVKVQAPTEDIVEYLEKQGKNCPADYLLLSYGATRGYLPAAVPSLNFQNGKLVDALIRILYRQFISKNCFDPGAFVAPVLEETGMRIAGASF